MCTSVLRELMLIKLEETPSSNTIQNAYIKNGRSQLMLGLIILITNAILYL